MSNSEAFTGPSYNKVDYDGKTVAEVTSDGASRNLQAAINAARDKDGVPDFNKLDPETARLNKTAFNMLMGEEPKEYMDRLGAIVGSEDIGTIVSAAIAVLGKNEARRQSLYYSEYNPLASAFKSYFESQDAVEQEAAAPTEAVVGLGRVGVATNETRQAMADVEAEASGPESITDLSEKLAVLSGALGNLDKYDVQVAADGTITVTPKSQ